VKNMALLCHVRVLCPIGVLAAVLNRVAGEWLVPCGDRADPDVYSTHLPVHANGIVQGFVAPPDAPAMLEALQRARRRGALPWDCSIYGQPTGLHLESDAGCLMAPVLRVDALPRLQALLRNNTTWAGLVHDGAVQYLDNSEEQSLRVARFAADLAKCADYTHVEIHPSLINGLCASIIPFSHHNQAPRNCYQSAMGKQAVGLYAGNLGARMDVAAHVLDYPAPPLVTTWVDDILGTDSLPCGETVTVAVLCYTGFNQEDSVIASQGAIDRGMFRSTLFRTYRAEERTNGSEIERFERPDTSTCLVLKSGNYDSVGADGFVRPGQRLNHGDCLIGMTMNMSEMGTEGKRSVKRDRSVFMRTHETETVDAVLRAQTPDGHRYCKVKTRVSRVPQVGDKLSSRHGQKGVIGRILQDVDMPFTRDGMVPDLIINPHALPSRMTLGHLVECLAGRVAAEHGTRSDGTPFRDVTVAKLGDALAEIGLDRTGTETMTMGTTGEVMRGDIYVGPTFYQRLKHMVADKRHARSRGPYQIVTRQPVEGRNREGGLRFGEMERDTLLSHGAAFLARDRLHEQSDPYTAPVCRACGMLAEHACVTRALVHRARAAYCRNCDAGDVAVIQMPYCMKLLLQELMVMGISSSMHIAAK